MQIGTMDPFRSSVSKEVRLTPTASVLMKSRDVVNRLEDAFQPYTLQLVPSFEGIRLSGNSLGVSLAEKVIERLTRALVDNAHLDPQFLEDAVEAVTDYALRYDLAFRLEGLPYPVRPLSLSQVAFMNLILYDAAPVVFGTGPTGTGKSHLAVAAAVSLVARKTYQYLVLTRPHILSEGEAMTAERRLDIVEEGQLTPLEDELSALIGGEPMNQLKKEGRLQVVPFGRLRGRTFNDGLLLVDDAQNLTIPQMRMALTRMGRNARIIITGDPDQCELYGDAVSGLTHALKLFAGQSFCAMHQFRESEIVRNPVVAEIEGLYSGAGHDSPRQNRRGDGDVTQPSLSALR